MSIYTLSCKELIKRPRPRGRSRSPQAALTALCPHSYTGSLEQVRYCSQEALVKAASRSLTLALLSLLLVFVLSAGRRRPWHWSRLRLPSRT